MTVRGLRAFLASHGGLRPPWFAVCGTAVLVAIYMLGQPVVGTLVFDPATAGEAWRLLSGHLVHLNLEHLAWNAGTFVLMSAMAERDLALGPERQLRILLVGAAAIDLLLWATSGGASVAYAGLSGVLNALLAVMLVESWRTTRCPSVLAVAALSVGKIAYEAATGDTLFVDVPWPAAAEGHAGGFLAGLAYAAVMSRRQTKGPARTPAPVSGRPSAAR